MVQRVLSALKKTGKNLDLYKRIYPLLVRRASIARQRYYRRLQRRLKNSSPTILSNNCFGGIVYHNLGLPFKSPTINLFFSNRDFITFVQDLPGFLQAELTEVKASGRNYPVGELESGGKTVRIYFMHYKSFDEAREKWNSRRTRVDFSNLSILMQAVTLQEDIARDFDRLPYENKLLIAANAPIASPHIRTLPILSKKGYRPGEVLEYGSVFARRRHMDRIDYVSFLNRALRS